MKTIKILLATLCTLAVVACGGGYGGGGYSLSSTSATYSISGTVTKNGTPLAGTMISLTGARSTSTTTDSNGKYSITSLANGYYTVTPSGFSYVYTPASKAVYINDANVPNTDFAAP